MIDKIYVTKTERGTFLAATKESPYFCLEADTEDVLKDKVRDLISFYDASQGVRFVSPSHEFVSTQFIPTAIIRRDELMAAG
ncbi:MAG: hypothetical protein V3U60_16380 [Gammaproteobacteria bacterium]